MARKRWFWFTTTAEAVLASITAKAVTTNRRIKHRRERGDSLVELALILPVLLLILMSILDFGRAVYAYHVVANCAREGARYGIGIENDPSAIATVVRNAAVGLDTSQLTVTVTYPTQDTVRVEVDYRFYLITPLVAQAIGSQSLVLHSAATMYRGY
ncbi:MAG: TadE/TadG family type IV pilus assembly protein [Anaerolineae bacterium]